MADTFSTVSRDAGPVLTVESILSACDRMAEEARRSSCKYRQIFGHDPVHEIRESPFLDDVHYCVFGGTAYVSPDNFTRLRFDTWMDRLEARG